jgi:hypothetical protein
MSYHLQEIQFYVSYALYFKEDQKKNVDSKGFLHKISDGSEGSTRIHQETI